MQAPFLLWLLSVSVLLVPACGGAGTAEDRRGALSAEELLEGHVRATGGREAHARLRNRVTRGRAELLGFPNHDWTASFVRHEAAPGFWSETLAFQDWENEEGTDGDIAWGYGHVKYPKAGHRLKTPPETADMAHLVAFNGHPSWRERYETVELAGTPTIQGTECYEVVLTPARGQPVSWFLDTESLLLVKSESMLNGTIIETYPSEYREVDGVLLPHRVRRLMWGDGPGTSMPFLSPEAGKQDLLLVVDSIRHDVEEAPGAFSVPPAIRTLVTGEGGLILDLGGGVTLQLTLIPAGEFLMGADTPEQAPPHVVHIAEPFYMGVTEVTNAQMRRWQPDFDSNDPRGGANIAYQQYIRSLHPEFDGDEQPAVYVPWEEAQAFTEWLGDLVDMTVRLPTEAEWEYACRAGTSTKYSWGDEDDEAHLYANTNDPLTAEEYRLGGPFPSDDGHRATAPVGSFLPNDFGLYDMHGNVAEWTADHWHAGFVGAPGDGTAWTDPHETGRRVAKGGSFESSPSGQHYFSCACAGRSWNYLGNRNFGTGFRVVVEVPRR